ncbi:DUF6959 family protein [Streptomyces sp. T028]|uniref:DUF6959 family protein n=1 Tax=Streptomyces sp. T028 TaxID=3394379 RepID=UPI003A84D1D5
MFADVAGFVACDGRGVLAGFEGADVWCIARLPVCAVVGGNDAVVRLPGRRFPEVLMQGDSLHILRGDLAEVMEACERGDLAEARDSASPTMINPAHPGRWRS